MSLSSLQPAATTQALLAALLRAPLAAPGLAGGGRASRAGDLSGADLVVSLRRARETLLRLADAARMLDTGGGLSALSAVDVRSSDPTAVRARVLPTADGSGPSAAQWRITVSHRAVAQENAGAALPSAGTGALAAGEHVLRITTRGGGTADIAITVEAGDTNAQALARVAAAVGAAGDLGVAATVVHDASAGTSRLVLAARDTGTSHAFTVTDVSGGIAAAAGVGGATTVAAQAVYTLDGATLTSDTNAILLDPAGDIQVTLAAVTSAEVQVSVMPNAARIGAAVTSLVRSYNTARRFFDDHADLFATTAAALRSLGSRFRASLGSVGIAPDDGGELAVDRQALRVALQERLAAVREILGGEGGVAQALGALAERQLSSAGGGLDPVPGAGYAPRVSAGLRWPARLLDAHA